MNASKILGAVLGAALVLTVGCGDDKADAKVRKEISEAGSATSDYIAKKVEGWKNDLRDLDDDIADWKKEAGSKAANATEESRKKMDECIANLKDKRDALAKSIDNAGDKTGDAWEEFEDGCDRAWSDLKESFADAKRKFD